MRTAIVVATVLVCANGSAAEPEDGLAAINKQAAGHRAVGDYEQLERLRLQRREVIADSKGPTSWKAGLEAINATSDLVDKLRYKQALDALRKAWAPFAEQSSGPVFGDVAMRMFEVAQQALAIYRDALMDGSPDAVASVSELRAALEKAVAQDPCAVEAIAMLAFLTSPAPDEAFLRAEVRPSLKRRNSDMLAITWRSGPVMPWHAPSELEKAYNTVAILQDLKYHDFLQPDFVDQQGTLRSGAVFRGIDANYAPFQVFYGRYLLMEITDASGRVRSAMVSLNRRGEWQKKYLQLLWRSPSEEEEKNTRG